ncbi:MAG: putative sugar nucleotidyl transferase, partial [Longimicrobiales bacterium]|nr:putative sugar nucleotidyl transferase [Longimicrobiales bacterium]
MTGTVKLILVEDARAAKWSPFAETRPVGELRFGAVLLRERAERWWGAPCAGYRVLDRTHAQRLAGFDEPGVPVVSDQDAASPPSARGAEHGHPTAHGTLLWLSRAAPSLS